MFIALATFSPSTHQLQFGVFDSLHQMDSTYPTFPFTGQFMNPVNLLGNCHALATEVFVSLSTFMTDLLSMVPEDEVPFVQHEKVERGPFYTLGPIATPHC